MPNKTKHPFPRFRAWLKTQTHRLDMVGALASDVKNGHSGGPLPFPDATTFNAYEQWIKNTMSTEQLALLALRASWADYQKERATYYAS